MTGWSYVREDARQAGIVIADQNGVTVAARYLHNTHTLFFIGGWIRPLASVPCAKLRTPEETLDDRNIQREAMMVINGLGRPLSVLNTYQQPRGGEPPKKQPIL